MIVTIDFETYYDKDYTLKKLSTSEYVRDRRFEAISCAIKVGDAPAKCYFGQEISPALRAVDWNKADLLAHHAHFEGLILSHHYKIVPRAYRDTLSMSRALYPKTDRNDLGTLAERLGVQNKLEMPDFKGKHLADLTEEERRAVAEYNEADVESCAQAYVALVARMPQREMDLIDVTVRMFADPVLRLDKEAAKAELLREVAEKRAAIAASGLTEKELASSAKFSAALTAAGMPCPTKVSPRTGEVIPALAQTDTAFTSLVNFHDPKVVALVKGRLAVKSTIGETRARRLLNAGRGRLRLPVYLNFCAAHTLRWSGGDKLNFQNFPRSGELRRTILAPKGQVIVVVDSRQIQPRILAWLAGERWMTEAFENGTDIYSIFASDIYGHVVTKAENEKRQVGKVCVLALGFGMGAPRLQQTLSWGVLAPAVDLPIEVCARLVRLYRQKSKSVEALWETLNTAIGAMALGRSGKLKCLSWAKDVVNLPDGLALHYPGTRAHVSLHDMGGLSSVKTERVTDGSYDTPQGRSKLYGGLFTENLVQALERSIMAEQMNVIAKRYRVAMMSHDEIAFLAPAKRAQEALEFGLEVVRTRPAWGPDLPLDSEGTFGDRYTK